MSPSAVQTGSSDDLPMLDVSLVVNVHDARNYLARTMRSLEASANVARASGLSVELLFALDRATPETAAWVERYVPQNFDRARIGRLDNGSLGLSRQWGLEAARAEYVQFCDDDDLVSSTMTLAMYRAARAAGPRTVVIPEYLFGFGAVDVLAHYAGTDLVSPLTFMAEHPYVSRIFVHRTIAEHVRYRDVPVGSGYAYEDWHFNASAVAAGLAYAAAPETVLYYRYRARGMLASMNAGSVRQIPPTPLFDPPTYVRVCRESYYRRRLGDIPAVDPEALRRDFLANRSIRRSNIEANRIDPAIDPTSAIAAPVTSNLSADHALGEAYFEVCRRVGPQHFTDVILATGLEPEGGRDPRIDIVTALAGLDPSVRTLILLHRDASAAITPELPPNTLLIDFAALATKLRPDQVDTVALRLIEATGSAARIHLSGDPFARRFWARYGRLLPSTRAIFDRAGDVLEAVPGGRIRHGGTFDFLAEHLDTFALVVTDSDAQSAFDCERIDRSSNKWRRLYRLGPELQAPTGLSRRVLAIEPASELNRVDLTKVAALASTGSRPIEIEEVPALPPSLDRYDVLLVPEADALDYGALSRALGAGMAIVGPECPAIREAVGEAGAGIVVGTPAGAALDAAVVEALRSIFQTDETALAFRRRARDTYASRHLGTSFERSAKELFS